MIRTRILLTVAFAIAFFSRAALPEKVVTDYDHAVSFFQYRTYSWGHVHSYDPLLEDRIRGAVDRALQAKGWHQVAAGGDVTVTAVAIEKDKKEYTTFYDGFGPRWRWHGWGPGMATTEIDHVPVGSLILDLYDSGSGRLVWRGQASDELSGKPDKDSQKLEKAVNKMLEKFPPQAKEAEHS
jgi:hypothetical protein